MRESSPSCRQKNSRIYRRNNVTLYTGRDAIVAVGGAPAQVLADGLGQFLAAQRREGGDGGLDVGELLAGEAAAEEGGGFELLDQRVHALSACFKLTIANSG